MGIIYKAINLINGKCYIGQTTKIIEERKQEHFYNRNNNILFHKAIKKYSFDNFQWEIIKECDDKLILNLMETFMIMVHHTHMSEGGYNMTWGGDGIWGYKHTEESRKKIKKKLIGRKLSDEHKNNISKWNKNKKLSDEHKEKISKAHKGKMKSEKHRVNISKSQTGEKNHNYGKHLTNEHKLKLSNPLTYFWEIHGPDDSVFITFGLKDFCLKYNLGYNSMKKIACGMQKKLYKKTWMCKKIGRNI